MATFRVTDPETGQTIRLTGDSPPSEQELEQIFASQRQPIDTQRQVSDAPNQEIDEQSAMQQFMQTPMGGRVRDLFTMLSQPGFAGDPRGIQRAVDFAAPIASSIVAEPVAGVAGIAAAPFVGAEAGDVVEQTREALTIPPQTGVGQRALETAGQALTPVGEAFEAAGETTGELGFQLAGPTGGAIGATIPTALAELAGLGVLRKVRRGTQLIDDAGRPTKQLRKALDSQGLDFDDLTPEARAAIPKVAEPGMLPGANVASQQAEKALIDQVRSGARTDSLAGLKVTGNKLVPDLLGKEALRQGFDPGFVQTIKTATPATRSSMKKMLNMKRAINKSRRKALDFRPSDVVGDSVMKRVRFLRENAKNSRNELNRIASDQLKGKPIDSTPIVDAFSDTLDDLGVTVSADDAGKVIPNFSQSTILKNKTAQKAIKDAMDLMDQAGPLDAFKAHQLKRQLDELIDFSSTPKKGMTRTAKNILKDFRRNINTAIREVDPDYARVNDTLSQSLTALDDIGDATGTIDLFAPGADKAVGTKVRSLLSNQQGRINLENSINSLDDVAANLGGRFDDNIKDLAFFADELDRNFGTTASTSFAGQVEQGIRDVQRGGAGQALTEKAIERAGKTAEKLRGVNEFNAFESLSKLLEQ